VSSVPRTRSRPGTGVMPQLGVSCIARSLRWY
jgi:hypothetical protein